MTPDLSKRDISGAIEGLRRTKRIDCKARKSVTTGTKSSVLVTVCAPKWRMQVEQKTNNPRVLQQGTYR